MVELRYRTAVRRRSSTRRGRLRALFLLLGLVLAAVPAIGSAQVDPSPEATDDEAVAKLKEAGDLVRFPDNLEELLGAEPRVARTGGGDAFGGWPFLDIANRRIFQLYELEPDGVALLIRDLDSLKKDSVIKIPEYRNLENPSYPSNYPDGNVEVDEQGKRLFVWTDDWNFSQKSGVVVIDWTKDQNNVKFNEMPPFPDGQAKASSVSVPTFAGLSFAPTARKLYVRFELDTSNFYGYNKTDVLQLDAAQDDPLTVRFEWARWIRACRSSGSLPGSYLSGDLPVLRSNSEEALYIPCNPGAATAVVRVPLSEAGLPLTEEVYPGIGFATQYLIDRVAERIHIKTLSQDSGRAVLTFDATKKAYVGLSVLEDPDPDLVSPPQFANPLAVDEVSGRVYALSDHEKYGITVIEGRLSPVPPGRQFPQMFGYNTTGGIPSLRFDSKTRRVFVPEKREDEDDSNTYRFVLFEDGPPLATPPTLDVDTLTLDIPEAEGVSTIAEFSGGASGYGFRVLLPGGARGFAPISPFEGVPPIHLLNSGCLTGDRDLVFGRVEQTFLAATGRSAAAIAAQGDDTTKTDALQPSRCEEKVDENHGTLETDPTVASAYNALTDPLYPQLDRGGQPWPFRRTECPVPTDDGGTAYTDSASGQPPFASSGSSVNCFPEKAQIAAQASMRPPGADAPVRVGEAGSFTEVVRDPKRGLVSRAIAYVRDIDLGGSVQIEGAYAVAESWATGRPESSNKIGAGTTYLRGITAFRSPSYSCGHAGEDACGDPSALIDGVNRALASANMSMRFPPLEPNLAAGTPKGYQAAVQREFFNGLNAEFANGDALKEIPAFEIVRANDAKLLGRQRQVFQFAGVLVNSQYGIRPMTEGVAPPPGGSTAPVPPAAQVLGGVISGVASGGSTGGVAISTAGAIPDLPGVPPAAAPETEPGGLGTRILEGLRILFSSPKTAGLLVGAWLLLLFPGVLAYRRRLLIDEITSGGRSS